MKAPDAAWISDEKPVEQPWEDEPKPTRLRVRADELREGDRVVNLGTIIYVSVSDDITTFAAHDLHIAAYSDRSFDIWRTV